MRAYANMNGNSPITAYEVGDDYIVVCFKGVSAYLYTAESAGREHIVQMQRLAEEGRGLSGYISKNVKKNYESISEC